ncbi:putative deoxynucleotide monophosphate kinase [Pseudogulbenkiania sp. NH8B]|uniref:deoxynucleotide monophosphate kinase family protein n=1 Tax=Pseudogulbenkiania sp. (strain NH8B) TaxID=748280 RepID=UPI00022794EB|nr:deoxynucleotide monophosphate kinase [Pseudogulbenkiania sp. NH8B]BAK75371.1 putative deoxynucleotide monophosphate kinase [Pseudogulbenkiania sp. NH8B]
MPELPKVIVLTGRAGSGKSTIAAELVASHGYTVVKFAGPLKSMLRALGLTDAEIEGDLKEKPCALLGWCTPRHAMQTLGTEWGRNLIDTDLWVAAWQHAVRGVLASGGRVVVDDCRFRNELSAAMEMGGVAVRLVRDGAGTTAHVSETGLDAVELPVIINAAAPAAVAGEVLRMAESILETLA